MDQMLFFKLTGVVIGFVAIYWGFKTIKTRKCIVDFNLGNSKKPKIYATGIKAVLIGIFSLVVGIINIIPLIALLSLKFK